MSLTTLYVFANYIVHRVQIQTNTTFIVAHFSWYQKVKLVLNLEGFWIRLLFGPFIIKANLNSNQTLNLSICVAVPCVIYSTYNYSFSLICNLRELPLYERSVSNRWDRKKRRAESRNQQAKRASSHLNSDQEFQIWDKCGNTKSHESVKLHCKPSSKAFQNYKKNKRESRQHENKSCFSPSCLWRKGQKSFHAYLQ